MDACKILVTESGKDTLFFSFPGDHCGYFIRTRNKSGGAIFVGQVENVIRNLKAAFVRFDGKEIGYLPFEDVPRDALLNRENGSDDLPLKAGDLLCVQTRHAAQGTKQAKLTGFLALQGNYAVLGLEKRNVGCSRALSQDIRADLIRAYKEALSEQAQEGEDTLPEDFLTRFGVILRTECGAFFERLLAEGADREDALQKTAQEALQDTLTLFQNMRKLVAEANTRPAGTALYRPDKALETNEALMRSYHFLERAVPDTSVEIVCATQALFESVSASVLQAHDGVHIRLNREADAVYGVKGILEDLTHRVVWLKSGAYLVIEETEAMTVVDVNSGKYIAKKDDDFLKVNLEAADAVMREIRLRDLSGIVVVDFINMREGASYAALKERLRTLAAWDPVYTHFHDITALGLAEITRTAH